MSANDKPSAHRQTATDKINEIARKVHDARVRHHKSLLDFEGFLKWIRQSHPAIFAEIRKDRPKLDALSLNGMLPILLNQLLKKDLAKRHAGLLVIGKSVSGIHPNPFLADVPHDNRQRVFDAVMQCLGDPDPTVRLTAIHALSSFPHECEQQKVEALSVGAQTQPAIGA